MKTRIAFLLGLLITVMPVSVAAQTDTNPEPATDIELVTRLCEVNAADADELAMCTSAVEATLQQLIDEGLTDERSLRDRAEALAEEAGRLIEDTLSEVRETDLRQALDEIAAEAQEIVLDADLQSAIDEAVAAIEELDLEVDIDIEAAIDGAVAELLAATEDADIGTVIDEALAEARTAIDEADIDGAVSDAMVELKGRVEEARGVVAAAQDWARENKDVVCQGGSLSLGTTAGVAVWVVTGWEWLGMQAFAATERFTNAVCDDIVE